MARKMSQKQIEDVRERTRQAWNAMVAREEAAERKRQAKQKRPSLRSVK